MVERDLERQVAVFSALSDLTRLRLVKLLGRQPQCHPLCVNALAQKLGVTQSAVSQHLRILKGVSMVKAVRQGSRVHYSLDEEAVARLHGLLVPTLTAGDGQEGEDCEECRPKGEPKERESR